PDQPRGDDRPGRVAVLLLVGTAPVRGARWGRRGPPRPGASADSQCSSSCWATPAAGPQWAVTARTSASDGIRPSREGAPAPLGPPRAPGAPPGRPEGR